jgi:hypothetical protein
VETGANFLAIEHAKDLWAPIFILTYSANHLFDFVKVRAHRGEPYNEAADRIASRMMATHDEDVPLLWNAPSGRIIYQFTPDPSDSVSTADLQGSFGAVSP